MSDMKNWKHKKVVNYVEDNYDQLILPFENKYWQLADAEHDLLVNFLPDCQELSKPLIRSVFLEAVDNEQIIPDLCIALFGIINYIEINCHRATSGFFSTDFESSRNDDSIYDFEISKVVEFNNIFKIKKNITDLISDYEDAVKYFFTIELKDYGRAKNIKRYLRNLADCSNGFYDMYETGLSIGIVIDMDSGDHNLINDHFGNNYLFHLSELNKWVIRHG